MAKWKRYAVGPNEAGKFAVLAASATNVQEKPGFFYRAFLRGTKDTPDGLLHRPSTVYIVLGMTSVLGAPLAHGFEIDTGMPDLSARWDNTLRYGLSQRTEKPSEGLTNSPPLTRNQDDGDRSFNRGIISNRLDLLSEFDAKYGNFGLRLSGAAWYDSVYNETNDNDSPGTVNARSVRYNHFTDGARDLHGQDAELLDAFVSGKGELGDIPGSFRLGRHSLLWGESLFFGNNGIAGTQSAVDVIKLSSVPNALFKETIRPDNQISGQLQLTPEFSIGAYYKFSWEENRFPAAGTYFASTDIINEGERLFTSGPPFPGGVPQALFRGKDVDAKDSGQGGVQLKWRPENTDVELGVYAVRYHDRNPVIYQYPGVGFNPATGQIGTYKLLYPEGITTYGISANTTLGNVSLAGEVSVRRNATLVSDAQIITQGMLADNNDHPRYAVGNTAHAQTSFIWTLEPNLVAQESTLMGELAWNRTTSVTKNPQAVAALAERDAWGYRLLYTPSYRQVLPGLDISIPIGGSYFPKGRSSAVSGFGVDKGGDFNLGVAGAYLDVWRFSLTYTAFYGKENTFLVQSPAGSPTFSFDQSLKDRDFVSLSLSRTF
jgi:hypothetical protein